ncbi:MAG: flagellar biosynthesis anti-sigma factor FlgM [Lachnospiraceae bacterium]|nr:flagellar biosynthesis anti-sigma factor FlgM [Lachnospiraceae bacterium]
MRIEAYNAMSQIYSAKRPNKVNSVNSVSRTDQISISNFGKDMQTVKQAVAGASDIRSEKVEPIKESIQNGSYSVDNGSFADRLYAKFTEKYSF